MQYLDHIDIDRYKELVLYDRIEGPIRISPEPIKEPIKGLVTTSSSGAIINYDSIIMIMSGFTIDSAQSKYYPTPKTIVKNTKELWMSLIGIFESGDPDFATNHDEIYRTK